MSLARERLEFAPPPTPGLVRAVLLALLAHGLLAGVLTAGIKWRRETPPVTVSAEIWSAVPETAAPPAPEPIPDEPVPVPPPEPEPQPEPPKPVEKPVPAPAPDIALAKEKAKLKKEKEKAERLEQEKLQKEKLQKEKLTKDKAQKDKQEKLSKDKKHLQEQKEKAELDAKENKKLAEIRQQNLRRMAGLAGGTGGPNDAGSAAQASGPSPGYVGRIKARIRPNVTFTEKLTGNPTAEVEIRTSPDGTIINQKLTKSSGVAAWDQAVMRGIEKTEVLPRDIDGTVPTRMTIVYSYRD